MVLLKPSSGTYVWIHILQNAGQMIPDTEFPLHTRVKAQALRKQLAKLPLPATALLMTEEELELLYVDQASWPAYQSVSWVPHLSACLMTYSYLNTQSESILSIPTAWGERASQLSVRRNSSWTNIIPMSRILSFVCFTAPLVDGNFSQNSFFTIISKATLAYALRWPGQIWSNTSDMVKPEVHRVTYRFTSMGKTAFEAYTHFLQLKNIQKYY